MTRLVLACCVLSASAADLRPRPAGVGVPVLLEGVVIPGSELEAAPVNRKDPVVVRIVAVHRHGTSMRYDLEYYGLDPGTFDLKTYLRRKDGSSSADVPSIPIAIESILPAGQVTPNDLPARAAPWLGGYRLALGIAAGLWLAAFVAILYVGRKRRRSARAAERSTTLAERLLPLVERAQAGTLTPSQRAELERMLLAYWRDRLDLGALSPQEAFARMRGHPESGPLLEALEGWLHRPGPSSEFDADRLLEPYRRPAALARANA